MECEYGCGHEATHEQTNGKWCCSVRYNQCPEIRRRNSKGLKKAYKEGRKDVLYFDGKRNWAKGKTGFSDSRIKISYDPATLFTKGTNSKRVKKVIIAEKILPYECAECGISSWQNKPLTLELDHINGVRDDNRLDNLRLICANCHSQTPNYRGRQNKGRNGKVYDTDVISAVKNSVNINQVLTLLGLSTNGTNRKRIERIMEDYNLIF